MLESEILLYPLNGQGEMEFLGVDYIIPFTALSDDATPPVLFDQAFHANQKLDLGAVCLDGAGKSCRGFCGLLSYSELSIANQFQSAQNSRLELTTPLCQKLSSTIREKNSISLNLFCMRDSI